MHTQKSEQILLNSYVVQVYLHLCVCALFSRRLYCCLAPYTFMLFWFIDKKKKNLVRLLIKKKKICEQEEHTHQQQHQYEKKHSRCHPQYYRFIYHPILIVCITVAIPFIIHIITYK